MGGVVAYHNALKRDLLGVSEAILAQEGAVSEACARQMAQGVRALIPADVGMSVTGIAGPDGGTPAKPVGLVYLGLAWGERVEVTRHIWQGDREANKRASVYAMLLRLLALLEEA
jgi:nicotinamide-nucleotide amidase